MQLVSNDGRTGDSSETEPILSQSNIGERTEESSSSIEITVSGDYSVATDSPSPDADESCSLVHADQPLCRICLDTGGEDLIAPCFCKGTQKYVHRSCLDNWRSTKEGFAFSHCTECRALFVLRANVPPDRWWLRLKFQFLVARDHAFIFLIVQLIVTLLGVLVYKFYGEELREMFGYAEHPYGFYTMAGKNPNYLFDCVCQLLLVYPCGYWLRKFYLLMSEEFLLHLKPMSLSFGMNCEVLAIVLVGLLYGFFIAIICGQRINERHYHVLAKQELTKEYIVEDREANKDVPELDQSHVTELRMLGLY